MGFVIGLVVACGAAVLGFLVFATIVSFIVMKWLLIVSAILGAAAGYALASYYPDQLDPQLMTLLGAVLGAGLGAWGTVRLFGGKPEFF